MQADEFSIPLVQRSHAYIYVIVLGGDTNILLYIWGGGATAPQSCHRALFVFKKAVLHPQYFTKTGCLLQSEAEWDFFWEGYASGCKGLANIFRDILLIINE
jgi:hypothetical protein